MKRLLFPSIVALGLALLAGCGGSTGSSGNASLRVIHLIADGSAYDAYADFSVDPLASSIAFKGSGGYQTVKAVTQSVDIFLAGTNSVFTTAAMSPGTGEKLSLLLLGSESNPQTLLISDITAAPPTGSVKLRLIHAGSSVNTVDVYITAPADPLPATPTYDDFNFGSQTGYLQGLAGSYRVRVTKSGNQTVILDSGTITLNSGDIKSWVIADKNGGGTPLQGVIYND